MKIYLDIAHPAYFHALRNFIKIMSDNGHDFFISAKDKDVTLDLLQHYSIGYSNRGKAANTPIGKAFNIIKSDFKLLRRVRRFEPDLIISFSSPIAAHLAFILHKPCITIEDTECAGIVQWSYLPFSDVVLTPTCFLKDFGKKHIYFNSYKELAYLHPNQFKTHPNAHQLLDINRNERYVLLRFVSHNALHDYGEQGIGEEYKIKLVEKLSTFSRVFISSENTLSERLKPYSISVPSWEMHSVIAGASLLAGESATMATEAAVLGVPSIFIDNLGRGYTTELEEKYNLVYNFNLSNEGLDKALDKAIELLQTENIKEIFQGYRQKMLIDKIDATAFLVWFSENYPQSMNIMKENPDHQYIFK